MTRSDSALSRARVDQVQRVNAKKDEIERLRQELATVNIQLRQMTRELTTLREENARLNAENDRLNAARLAARAGNSAVGTRNGTSAGDGAGVSPLPMQWGGDGGGVLSQTEAAHYLSQQSGRTIHQYQIHRWLQSGHFQAVKLPGKSALHVRADSLYIPPPGRAGRKAKSAPSGTKGRS